MNSNKSKFLKIPLISKWHILVTLIFIIMKVTNIIDWNPLWILSPLWLPWLFALSCIVIPYLFLGIILLCDYFYNKIQKLKNGKN